MATIAQLTANRLNSQSSTGPCTDSGKQASSRNAVRHGLYASVNSLASVERAQFDEILAHFSGQYPEPDAQTLLHELALAWFRRERVRTMEAAFFSVMLEKSAANDPGLPHDRLLAALLIGDAQQNNLFSKLQRWERAFTRDIDRALKSLQELAQSSNPEPAAEIAETKPIPAPNLAPQSLNSPCRCGSGLKYKRCCGAARHANAKTQSSQGLPSNVVGC